MPKMIYAILYCLIYHKRFYADFLDENKPLFDNMHILLRFIAVICLNKAESR